MNQNILNEIPNSIRKSIQEQNWISALFLAITLPDICGKLDHPKYHSQQRSSLWFKKYIEPKYTSNGIIFFDGNDFYALRCSLLHECSDITSHQKASKFIAKFDIVSPVDGIVIHNNLLNNRLQIQIDIFCNDIAEGFEQWYKDFKINKSNESIVNNIINIPSIFQAFSQKQIFQDTPID